MAESSSNADEKRLWIGNLDTRISEYQLLKIVQKCGDIEKFDVLFHKSGPQVGQPRGYAFVTYNEVSGAQIALDKLNGQKIGSKTVIVRLAKNINYDELEKPRPKIDIPALAAGSSASTIQQSESRKISKKMTIEAIEAKLKMLENRSDDFVVNKTIISNEQPLIQKYQFNKNSATNATTTKIPSSIKYNSKIRTMGNPYHKRHKR